MIIFLPFYVYAETYKEIGPLDTLGDLKEKFPKAEFSRFNPAWAKDTDVLYQIAGVGMSDSIVIKLYDGRPVYKKYLEENPEGPRSDLYRKLMEVNDEEALTLTWVRWVPNYPMPISRYISKYGQPDNRGYDDERMQPYWLWKKKGLVAYLTDNKKYVDRVDYIFTTAEECKAWKDKFGFIPEWIKEPSGPSKKK